MAEVRLGLDAVLTIDGTEIKNCKDLTVSLEKAEADASTRDNNGWRATVGTLKDASIEFTVLNKDGDPSFGLLQSLFMSGNPADVGVSDAGGTLTLTCECMNFTINQQLEEVISADVTLKPTQSSAGGGMNVGSGGGGSLRAAAAPATAPKGDDQVTMSKFVDAKNRIWVVDVTNTTLRRVKSLTDVRLMDAVDGELIPQMSQDFLLLGEVLFAVCKPQADRESITQEEFESGLAGDHLTEARDALVEALLEFLPEDQRRLLTKAVAHQREVTARGMEMLHRRLDDPNLISQTVAQLEANLAVPALNGSSTSSPASSVSTPDR